MWREGGEGGVEGIFSSAAVYLLPCTTGYASYVAHVLVSRVGKEIGVLLLFLFWVLVFVCLWWLGSIFSFSLLFLWLACMYIVLYTCPGFTSKVKWGSGLKVFASYLLTCITKCAMVWELPLSLYNPFHPFSSTRVCLFSFDTAWYCIRVRSCHSLTHSLTSFNCLDGWGDPETPFSTAVTLCCVPRCIDWPRRFMVWYARLGRQVPICCIYMSCHACSAGKMALGMSCIRCIYIWGMHSTSRLLLYAHTTVFLSGIRIVVRRRRVERWSGMHWLRLESGAWSSGASIFAFTAFHPKPFSLRQFILDPIWSDRKRWQTFFPLFLYTLRRVEML